MHRVTVILLMASLLSLGLMGLVLPATLAMGARTADAPQSQSTVAIHMASNEGGPPRRTFAADTGQLYAVVTYQGATNEYYVVRLTDLLGLRVLTQPIGPLTGSGTISVRVGVDLFVQTYASRYQQAREQLVADNEAIVDACENRPPVPDPWPIPEPTPGPGPTPSPNPYLTWAEYVMGKAEQIRSTSGEITRTLHALTVLPDVAERVPEAHAQLVGARQSLISAHGRLAGTPKLLLPNSGRPDPEAACQAIRSAGEEITSAVRAVDATLPRVTPASDWRLPPTTARYERMRFAGCSQYQTDLVAGQDPSGTAALSAPWTVGDPGPPALVFPAAEQTDPSLVGLLGLRLPEGARYLYARQVTVPGAPHEGDLAAFVTDANCLPLSERVVLWTAPDLSGGATVDPSEVQAVQGEASAKLRAGDDVTHMRSGGWVIACAGQDCVPLMPTPKPGLAPAGQAWGSVRFEVVGTADPSNTLLKVEPEEINRAIDETAGVALQVNDRNGRSVANGTRARIWIDTGSPGMLAFDRRRVVGGRPVGDPERVVLGKSADVVVENGLTRLPPSTDPAFVDSPRLYLFAGDRLNGEVTICYQVDAVEACVPRAVKIISRIQIYLPSVSRAHAQYDATATATRWRPTIPAWLHGVP